MGTPKTLNDIIAITNVKRKHLTRDYRFLVVELDLTIPLVDPLKCIARITNKSNISEKTKRQAMIIMNEIIIKEEVSAGKNPMGLAATVLYLSCLKTGVEKVTQSDIAAASGVTEMTIRNRFNDLKRRLEIH